MLASPVVAAEEPAAEPAAEGSEPEPAPRWRFTRDDRPVKVVVLAGSIGAWRAKGYAWHLQDMCSQVEVENLSKTGLGAWALKHRFRDRVLDNRRIDWNAEGTEYWLVFGGGLNSIANPHANADQMRRLFMLAHARGMRVVGLTVTPWGDDDDRRFRGIAGLRYRDMTEHSVDFMMKRLTPQAALGRRADKRPQGPLVPWSTDELPDIAIDLYDSPLRDRSAPLRDVQQMREQLEADDAWQRAHRDLSPEAREQALQADAERAAELPRWYLRPELRSFDHIHPNAEGHRLMADVICPQLPESWGCTCRDPAAD